MCWALQKSPLWKWNSRSSINASSSGKKKDLILEYDPLFMTSRERPQLSTYGTLYLISITSHMKLKPRDSSSFISSIWCFSLFHLQQLTVHTVTERQIFCLKIQFTSIMTNLCEFEFGIFWREKRNRILGLEIEFGLSVLASSLVEM